MKNYIIYKIEGYNFAWGIFNLDNNVIYYIRSFKKIPGTYTLSEFCRLAWDTGCPITKHGKTAIETIQLHEKDNKIKIIKINNTQK